MNSFLLQWTIKHKIQPVKFLKKKHEKAYGEYEKYKVIQDRSFISDFDRFNDGDKLLPFDINPDKE